MGARPAEVRSGVIFEQYAFAPKPLMVAASTRAAGESLVIAEQRLPVQFRHLSSHALLYSELGEGTGKKN